MAQNLEKLGGNNNIDKQKTVTLDHKGLYEHFGIDAKNTRLKFETVEVTHKKLEQMKQELEMVEAGKKIEKLHDMIKAHIEQDTQSSLEAVKTNIETATKTGNLQNTIKATKEITSKFTKKTAEIGTKGAFIKGIEKFFGGFFKGLKSAINKLFGFFGIPSPFDLGEKAEKAGDIAGEASDSAKKFTEKAIEITEKDREEIKEEVLGYFKVTEGKNNDLIEGIGDVILDPNTISNKDIARFKTAETIEERNKILYEIFVKVRNNPKVHEKILNYESSIIKENLQKKYGIVVNTDKFDKIKKIVKKRWQSETMKSVIDSKFLSIGDGISILFETGENQAFFFLDLISEGIIDISTISIDLIEMTGEGLKIALGVMAGNTGMEKIIGSLDLEDIYTSVSNMEREQKILLLSLFQRKGQLLLNMFGVTAGALTSTLISASEGIGEIATKATGANLNGGEYFKTRVKPVFASHIKETEGIAKIIQELGGETPELKIMKEAFEELEKSFSALGTSKAVDASSDAFNAINKAHDKLGLFVKDGAEGLTKSISFNNRRLLRIELRKLRDIAKINGEIAKGTPVLSQIAKFKQRFLYKRKIPGVGDKSVLFFKNADDIEAGAKILNNAPSIVKRTIMHSGVMLIGAGLYESFKGGDKGAAYDYLVSLVPIVGPFLLIKDTGIDFEKREIRNQTDFTIGSALLVTDVGFIVHDTITGGWKGLGKGIIRPATMIYEVGKDIATIGKSLPRIIRGLPKGSVEAIKALKSLGKKGAIATGLVLLAWGTYEIFNDDTKEILEEAGMLKKDGSLDMAKVKENFNTLNNDNQIELLKLIILSSFSEKTVSNININGDKIYITTPEEGNKDSLEDEIYVMLNNVGLNNMKIEFDTQTA